MAESAGWVVDASVAVKWLVPEPLTAEARRVLRAAEAGRIRIHVPEIWLSEVANSLLKKTRRPGPDRIDAPMAARMLASARSLGVAVHSHGPLVAAAFALACGSGLSLYDALYAALALSRDSFLVTADDRLLAGARDGGLGDRAVALRDVAAALDPPASAGRPG